MLACALLLDEATEPLVLDFHFLCLFLYDNGEFYLLITTFLKILLGNFELCLYRDDELCKMEIEIK